MIFKDFHGFDEPQGNFSEVLRFVVDIVQDTPIYEWKYVWSVNAFIISNVCISDECLMKVLTFLGRKDDRIVVKHFYTYEDFATLRLSDDKELL